MNIIFVEYNSSIACNTRPKWCTGRDVQILDEEKTRNVTLWWQWYQFGSKSLFNQDDKKYFVRAVFLDNNDVPVSINIPNAIVCQISRQISKYNNGRRKRNCIFNWNQRHKLDILFVDLECNWYKIECHFFCFFM